MGDNLGISSPRLSKLKPAYFTFSKSTRKVAWLFKSSKNTDSRNLEYGDMIFSSEDIGGMYSLNIQLLAEPLKKKFEPASSINLDIW